MEQISCALAVWKAISNEATQMKTSTCKSIIIISCSTFAHTSLKVENYLIIQIITILNLYPLTVSNLGGDVYAAFNMMSETVAEYLDNSNYFTVELKHKLVDYEYKLVENEKKMSWKHFFLETYAEE